jgi:hypothetical protein
MEKLITPYKKNHFFGYYDKSPLNYDKTYVISHEVESSGRRIKKTDSAKICITNLQKKTTKEIDETYSWNYQQGAQLQWLSKNKIIYNSFNKNYCSKIYDIETSKVEGNLNFPIYSISSDKKIYSTVNYARLHKFREGYGYQQKDYEFDENLLKICSINNGEVFVEINISDFSHIDDMNTKCCWIDHILFSPKSYDFVFLLRSQSGNSNLLSYLFFYDYEKKKIHNVINTGMAGHGSWFDENNFVIWARQKQFTKKINKINNSVLKKIINLTRYFGVPDFIRKNLYGDNYISFNKKTLSIKNLKLNIPFNLAGGHFSFINNDNLMISDTYHNNDNESLLFSYDMNNHSLREFYKFKCIPSIKDKSYRCDLHPRIISTNEIIIDSTHEGFRGIYSVKV